MCYKNAIGNILFVLLQIKVKLNNMVCVVVMLGLCCLNTICFHKNNKHRTLRYKLGLLNLCEPMFRCIMYRQDAIMLNLSLFVGLFPFCSVILMYKCISSLTRHDISHQSTYYIHRLFHSMT